MFDAGTGIRELGKALTRIDSRIFVVPTHSHWDHIQGFPFFAPIYQPDRAIFICATPRGKEMLCSLIQQMDGAFFPVHPDQLPSQPKCVSEDIQGFLRDQGFQITSIATNHPGGACGYRLDDHGRLVVYLTDNELDPPYEKTTSFDEFVRFCAGADVLVHDAQYVDADMPAKHGWGHSLVRQACELAAAARVKHLVLYHHDPDRTDDQLDSIQNGARSWLEIHGPSTQCTAAYEGLTITL